MIKSKPLALLALFVASMAYAYTTTVNMSLKTPASGDTDYPTSIADSFTLIDAHDHTTGKGVQIPTGGIANAAITGAKLAASSVDNSTIEISAGSLQLKNAGITGSKVGSNINLPGNAAQENGKNLVVSNTNATTSLSVVRGVFTSAAAITSGEGFSVVKNGTGDFTITFTTAFSDVPAVTFLPIPTSGRSVGIISESASSVRLGILSEGGGSTDYGMNFIAIGQR